jgi:hypothetical protein
MGWKSTIEVRRVEAIDYIHSSLHRLTNEELADVLYPFGDISWSSFYGHNFRVVTKPEEQEAYD